MDKSDDAGCEELFHRVQGPENASCVSQLLAAESEIPICSDSTLDEEFMAEIGPESKEVCEHDDEDCDQDGPEDVEPPPPRLNLREVVEYLKQPKRKIW